MPAAAPAPELGGAGGWIGVARPVSMATLRGRVVLVAFWAASDVASHRLLEDLRHLEDLFADRLVVVAVHSPRFPHEAEHGVVEAAVARHAVAHAVVDDADHRVFEAYGVAEWPTVVVVDPAGEIYGYVAGKGCGPALEKVVAQVLEEVPAGAGSRRRRLPAVARALLPTGPLAFPGKVAASPDGRRLAVADTAHDRVLVCSLEGVVLEAHTGYLQPQGVRFDGDGVVICDTGADRLVRTGGEVLADAVAAPWDVAADGPSWLIAEAGGHRVLRLRPGELRVRLVAGTGQEGSADGPVPKATLSQPSGVARIPAGVVVADAGTGRLRLVADAAVAEVSTIAGGDGDALQFPLGLASHPAGGPVYVADTYNSALRAWDGTALRTLPVAGLNRPGGLDLLPDGRLVVADTGNHRIVVVDPASGRVDPVEVDETWVHGDDGPPVRLAPGGAAIVPFGIDLVDELLDAEAGPGGPPVEVVVEARPAALLAGGEVRLGLDRPSGTVEVRGGSPGAGLLLVQISARTLRAGGTATRVHRSRHELEVGGASG